jgi:Skp family chaperone for outer membrane proteins
MVKKNCALFFLFAIALSLPAQKIATVDLEKVVQSLPETKVAQDKLDSSVSYLQRVHAMFEDSIQLIKTTIPHGGPINAQQQLYYEKRLKDAQDALANFEKEAHDGLVDFRSKLYAPLIANAKKLSIVVAKAYHYSALVEVKNKDASVLYSKFPVTDITEIVQKEIIKHTSGKK